MLTFAPANRENGGGIKENVHRHIGLTAVLDGDI